MQAVSSIVLDACPHCHTKQVTALRLWIGGAPLRGALNPSGHLAAAYSCNICGMVIGAVGEVGVHTPPEFTIIKIIPEPQVLEVSDKIPERARNYLFQAKQSAGQPDGAAMLAGSSVDAMLKSKGYKKGSLYSRIKQATKDGLLTKEMGEWAHNVRLDSNNPRHADEDDPHVTPEDAMQAIEFVEALGQFVFVLPARVSKGLAATKPDEVPEE